MNNEGSTILGILAGTAVGAILGILFAPDKGVNTRKKIGEQAVSAQDALKENANEIKDKLGNKLAHTKETLETKVASLATDASYKTEDVITSLENQLKILKSKAKELQKS